MSQSNHVTLIVPIRSPWKDMLQEAIGQVRSTLFFVSPYIKREIITMVMETLLTRGSASAPFHVKVVTRTLAEEFLDGSSDIEALQQLLQWPMDISGSTIDIRAINNVHAKVWIFDTSLALVGSGNATPSGLVNNLEYGLAVSDPVLVAQIQNDWLGWWEQAPQVTTRQLEEMQIWLNKVKNNEQLLQIEADAEKKRKTVERKMGFPPSIGRTLQPIPNKKASSTSPSSERNASLTDTPSATGLGEHNQHSVVTSDPPWEKVLDLSTSLVTLSQDLLYHGWETSLNANGELTSFEYPSLISVTSPAHEDTIKVPTIPKDAVEIPGEHLWRALLATFPIVDAVRAKDGLENQLRFREFLRIGWTQKNGMQQIQCIWSDQNRVSQVTFARKRRAIQSQQAVALSSQNALYFMKRLNAALRDGLHASTNIHLSLESSPYQLLLFYSLNILFGGSSQNFGQITIPYQQLDMANLLSPNSSNVHSYFLTVSHKSLAEALLQLMNRSSLIKQSLSEVEFHFNPPGTITVCSPDTSLSCDLSADELTHFETPLMACFDYASLMHILFYSSYGVHAWQISVGMDGKKIQFTSTVATTAGSTFKIQHELQNLVR